MALLPKKAYITKGSGVSDVSELNAFDKALLDAGVGNASLVKCTSILPPDIQILNEMRKVSNGEILFSIYAKSCAYNDGEDDMEIFAGLGIARTEKMGLVAELEFKGEKESIEEKIGDLLREVAESRGLEIDEIYTVIERCVVPPKRYGCAVAIVAIDV